MEKSTNICITGIRIEKKGEPILVGEVEQNEIPRKETEKVLLKEDIGNFSVIIRVELGVNIEKDMSVEEHIKLALESRIDKLGDQDMAKLTNAGFVIDFGEDALDGDYSKLKLNTKEAISLGYNKALINPLNRDPINVEYMQTLFKGKNLRSHEKTSLDEIPKIDDSEEDNKQTGEC